MNAPVTLRAFLPLTLAMLAACQPGGSGRLMPVAAQGVTLSKEAIDNDTAEIAAGDVKVRVTGFWNSNGGQNLYAVYTNGGKAPVRVTMGGWTLAGTEATAPLYQVLDITGMDPATADIPAGDTRRLYDDALAGQARELIIPAGQSRSLSVGFARFAPEAALPVVGTEVTARLPTPAGGTDIRFTCAGGVT